MSAKISDLQVSEVVITATLAYVSKTRLIVATLKYFRRFRVLIQASREVLTKG